MEFKYIKFIVLMIFSYNLTAGQISAELEQEFRFLLSASLNVEKNDLEVQESLKKLEIVLENNPSLVKNNSMVYFVNFFEWCLLWLNDEQWNKQAVRYNNQAWDIIDILLKHGADINQSDALGKTALHHAASHPRMSNMIAHLCYKKARVDAQDLQGNTPLLEAIKASSVKIKNDNVIALLQENADIFAENHNGDTPLHVACQLKSQKILAKILKFKCRHILEDKQKNICYLEIMNKQNSKEKSPLDYAEKSENYNIFKLFL